jgi:negative regulator of flagellin synthesis FlgM
MSNSDDNISSIGLLSPAERTDRAKEATGKHDKDVAETRSQSRGIHRLPTKQTAPTYPAWYLREIERDLRSVPVVDQEKVDRIKKRIADGNYQIDADVIAGKIMTTDELLA